MTDVLATPHLTPRQLEAARLAADGLKLWQVAAHMGVAPNTVKTHLRMAYASLGVSNRVELRKALARLGLLVAESG